MILENKPLKVHPKICLLILGMKEETRKNIVPFGIKGLYVFNTELSIQY